MLTQAVQPQGTLYEKLKVSGGQQITIEETLDLLRIMQSLLITKRSKGALLVFFFEMNLRKHLIEN